MGFVDELREANGRSMPRFYGEGTPSMQEDLNQIVPLRKELLHTENEAYKDRKNFDSNLDYQNQIRMRSMLDPAKMGGPGAGVNNPHQMNTVMGAQGGLSEKDKAGLELDRAKLGIEGEKLGIDKQKLALDSGNVAADNKLGQDRLAFDKDKDSNANTMKIVESERKANEANSKLELAKSQLEQRATNAQAQESYRQAQIAAQTATHELAMARAAEDKRVNDSRIAQLEEQIRASKSPKVVKTEVSPNGDEKTVTTESGGGFTVMFAPDGRKLNVPNDQVGAMRAKGATTSAPASK